jgi:hypothetical protein
MTEAAYSRRELCDKKRHFINKWADFCSGYGVDDGNVTSIWKASS